MDEPRTYYLAGERLYLRELRPEDAAGNYLAWMNDPEITQFLESRFRSYTEQDLLDYIEVTSQDPNSYPMAICQSVDGRHVGNIKLGPVNTIHRHGDIGIIIGERDCWGKGYATEAIRLLVDFAFEELGLHKVTAGCYSDNPGSAKAFLKAGFVEEGVKKEQYLSNGVYVDGILLGMVNGG
ncbi:MAG: GNAT family N-acetyltransferase [Bacteroidia bacterium]|nr:GNAT family N-acetyltransferase [Bacteroidia bacterium]